MEWIRNIKFNVLKIRTEKDNNDIQEL